jgi:hypothetical protein
VKPKGAVQLVIPNNLRRWFAVVNNPDRSRPWISRAKDYVPGTATDPYQPEPDPALN